MKRQSDHGNSQDYFVIIIPDNDDPFYIKIELTHDIKSNVIALLAINEIEAGDDTLLVSLLHLYTGRDDWGEDSSGYVESLFGNFDIDEFGVWNELKSLEIFQACLVESIKNGNFKKLYQWSF
jgi:hypothetical protein